MAADNSSSSSSSKSSSSSSSSNRSASSCPRSRCVAGAALLPAGAAVLPDGPAVPPAAAAAPPPLPLPCAPSSSPSPSSSLPSSSSLSSHISPSGRTFLMEEGSVAARSRARPAAARARSSISVISFSSSAMFSRLKSSAPLAPASSSTVKPSCMNSSRPVTSPFFFRSSFSASRLAFAFSCLRARHTLNTCSVRGVRASIFARCSSISSATSLVLRASSSRSSFI
mmetsp:Transcript_5976/g.10410  ORF Transcript_5976/g.10410 Transcript_5976/m.10410 type:complete len:226 (+) Transcript_5976:1026-1703(+)